MKKLLLTLLALCMLLPAAAQAQAAAPASLIIGSPTELSGSFYSDLWGNNTSDMDVRGLIHGYATVAWQLEGNYAVNETALEGFETAMDANGNKIYTFALNPNLKWNNGQPVTARDYVFTVLLQSSPELAALGASNMGYAHLLGQEAFAADSGAPFSGVRLLSDASFSLTVRAEYLPYFYELMYVNVEPTPMAVVAPGIRVEDGGSGAYLTPEPVGEGGQAAVFTSELLAGTLLAEDGYVHFPRVTCGAYTLTGYDAQTHVAQFEKNPYFLGNFEGQTPEMERLTFRSASYSTMLDELKNGTLDILNKVSDGEAIAGGLAMVNADEARSITYPRSGFAFLSFACEDETGGQSSVRKALSMCVDTDALCSEVLNGYALPVYGYYGLGQWMTTQDSERLNELNRYGYDPTGAKALLVEDGWTYNAQGQPFTEGVDDMRYKMADGRMIPLELRMAMASESAAGDNVRAQLTAAAETLGAKLSVTVLPFSEVLSHYYRQTEREYNLFLLGTNFSHVFDPYYAFHTGDEYQGVLNTTGIRDEELMKRAAAMRSVENGDVETYFERWFSFQERFVELLPMIPLYSNVYFDFVRPDLYGYQINTHWGWSSAILYATFTEPEEDEAATPVEPGAEEEEVTIID